MLSSLEPRYVRILKLIAEGLTTKEIAQLLGRSHHTVNTYIKELKRELANEPEARGRLPSRTALSAIYRRLYPTNAPAPEILRASSNPDWSFDQLLTLARLLSEAATSTLWSGIPNVTAQIASSACEELEAIIQHLPARSDYRDEFLEVLIQLVIQQGWANSQLSPFHTNWCLNTGFDHDLRRMADRYGRKELAILAEFFLADGYSLAYDYDNAVKCLESGLQAAASFDHSGLNSTRFQGLIKLASIWSIRANQQEATGSESLFERRKFWAVARQIEESLDMLNITDPSVSAYAYDRLATATASFQMPVARDYLDKARHYTSIIQTSGQPVPLREAQLIDVEFSVRKALDPGSSCLDMEPLAIRGIQQAMLIGCTRLALVIQNWLQ